MEKQEDHSKMPEEGLEYFETEQEENSEIFKNEEYYIQGEVDRSQRVVLVTGAASGLGFNLVKDLCKPENKEIVLLTDKSEDEVKTAYAQLLEFYPDSKD